MAQEELYRRGMVVVAHADDAEYGCAGTVAQWCRNGMEVVYVVCTDGSKGSSEARVEPAPPPHPQVPRSPPAAA